MWYHLVFRISTIENLFHKNKFKRSQLIRKLRFNDWNFYCIAKFSKNEWVTKKNFLLYNVSLLCSFHYKFSWCQLLLMSNKNSIFFKVKSATNIIVGNREDQQHFSPSEHLKLVMRCECTWVWGKLRKTKFIRVWSH